MGFFSPLKQAWRKSVAQFQVDNPGLVVDKSTFAQVFKRAYLSAVKPGTIVNAFENAGIYPPNRHAFDEKKLEPSKVFKASSEVEGAIGVGTKRLALRALEEELEKDVVSKYEERLKENYDLDTDPLYNTWKKLKVKSTRIPLSDISNASSSKTPLQEILQIPITSIKIPIKTIQGTACLPKHLSGSEVIGFLEERQNKRDMEEKEKEERKQQREERKKEKEKEEQEKLNRRKQ